MLVACTSHAWTAGRVRVCSGQCVDVLKAVRDDCEYTPVPRIAFCYVMTPKKNTSDFLHEFVCFMHGRRKYLKTPKYIIWRIYICVCVKLNIRWYHSQNHTAIFNQLPNTRIHQRVKVKRFPVVQSFIRLHGWWCWWSGGYPTHRMTSEARNCKP